MTSVDGPMWQNGAPSEMRVLSMTVLRAVDVVAEILAADSGDDPLHVAERIIEAVYPIIAAGIRNPAAAKVPAQYRPDGPVEIASLSINVEVGCSGEYQTEMRWPDGRVATYRDRLAIISGDSELPPTDWQVVFERMSAQHERDTRAADSQVASRDEQIEALTAEVVRYRAAIGEVRQRLGAAFGGGD